MQHQFDLFNMVLVVFFGDPEALKCLAPMYPYRNT